MSTGALAQPAPTTQVLFENVRVFDGKADALSAPLNVLVRGNKIDKISGAPIAVDRSANTTVVAGGGRTLMPGLIDAHWHAMNAAVPLAVAFNSDPAYLNLLAAKEAQNTLLRGFTSVRDLAGPSFSLKKAIDGGVVNGPRIWPSSAMISQTNGHGDFRKRTELPWSPSTPLSEAEKLGGSSIADGAPEVLRRARASS